MFGTIKATRAARQARRQYELAMLESLIAQIGQPERSECKWCVAMETDEQQDVCEGQFNRA